MIGQTELRNLIKLQSEHSTLPRFSIIVGPQGSGKKLIASEFSSYLCYYPTFIEDLSIGNIREVINESYKVIDTHVYILINVDSMSINAKNSLLKVLEEPPNNSYFIMTCENIDNVLPTIRSRGTIYNMQPYSYSNLIEYYLTLVEKRDDDELDIITEVCDTPGDINLIRSYDVKQFYDYVNLVVDNIAEVSGANAFKIANKIQLGKDAEGYDLSLFWKAFKAICVRRINEDADRYCKGISITNKYANELGISAIRKTSLFDGWLLDIRKEWL